ncbi:LysR family transcriptional regulator [Leeia sp. TBRC 13508]|uniref:LysR family transcriptional regulator n=1 Tax=Leeia speluncae TaxID=2884804 RepID=A0ABS8D4H2_9NEIS|nr:LysR family transcriptional regulator [Leeia speluncae]MCB6183066.1 LysR family transcriptional regulator [Leeia speluncae]
MSLSFRQVKYFVATAEMGQISMAAAELCISQSAVTTAIKELEQLLGTELFQRSSHGMVLTESGRRFLPLARQILDSISEAMKLSHANEEIQGTLRIAATYTVLGYFFPHHLQRLSNLLPEVTINLFELNREVIEEGLITGRYDLAVVLTSNLVNPELASETFINSQRRVWVPAGHRFLKQDRVSLADIAEEPYIMLTVDEAAYTALRYWHNTPFQPDIRLRTSSVEAVRSIVANGGGVAILSDMVYRPWSLEGKRIETVLLQDPVPAMAVGLAWKKGIEFTPAMTAVQNYFRQMFMGPSSMPHVYR